jgi:hypothetical protein
MMFSTVCDYLQSLSKPRDVDGIQLAVPLPPAFDRLL